MGDLGEEKLALYHLHIDTSSPTLFQNCDPKLTPLRCSITEVNPSQAGPSLSARLLTSTSTSSARALEFSTNDR